MLMPKLIVLAAALALVLVGCSSDTSSDRAVDNKRWNFTDDLGNEIDLEAAPQRIVAHKDIAAALGDMGLGDRVVGVFGAPDSPDPDLALQSPNLDLKSLENLSGAKYGEIAIEKLMALKPDLVLTSTFDKDGDRWWFGPEAVNKLKGVVDIATINLEDRPLDALLQSSERLATALGAGDEQLKDGRDAFVAAGDRLKKVAASAGDPSILVVAPNQDEFYVANPPAYIDLAYYADVVGLNIVIPKKKDVDPAGYWQTLSWENAATYPDASIAMWDARAGQKTLELLRSNAVWGTVEAAKSEAYVPWRTESALSPAGYARTFEKFASDLEKLRG